MLKSLEVTGFKSFGRKVSFVFGSSIAAIVGPNGSGKSNVAESLRFVLGEQSMKSMRSRKGEDLIWGGSAAMPRANRASVKVTFDNVSRRLDLDFDEVILERVVYRDGQNEYLLNGSQVRLKDVIRLLAGANIGGSGYQIISQGEADRILNSSPRERREMVEDALGLKLYQHKKAESERKLEETHENIEKVQSLRRELAPHLKFLGKQIEKIEKAREFRDELATQLAEYLARENAWITQEGARVKSEHDALSQEIHGLRTTQEEAKEQMQPKAQQDDSKVRSCEQVLAEVRTKRDEVARALGRAEGAVQALAKQGGTKSVDAERALSFARTVREAVEAASRIDDIAQVRNTLAALHEDVRVFTEHIEGASPDEGARSEAEREVAALAKQLADIESEESVAREALRAAQDELAKEREVAHEAERSVLTADARLRELEGKLREVESRKSTLEAARRAFEEEVREGIVLIGERVHAWEDGSIPEGALMEGRDAQEKRRRDVERLKIKVEEYGAGNSEEIIKEFSDTKKRDEFLERELNDLARSEETLRQIIEELDATMDKRFSEGLEKINEALHTFFTRLFNGGDAKLLMEKPRAERVLDPDAEEDMDIEATEEKAPVMGLNVSVQLPRKKVRGLEALSGGERALTSIALIFAMSQVNPPPFLILDETDAALDEANSRRYAEMIKALSERSQLILITHNRATMAAAGELYGVTMGQDGVSKLLSVKLEEAVRVAK